MNTEMQQEAAQTESARADSVQRVVRARHPWQQMWDAKAKLKAARKEAKRRYERTSEVRNDEFRHLKANEYALKANRRAYRKRVGLPLDTPKMKPWDAAKGKCPNDQAEARLPDSAASATKKGNE